MHGLDGDDRYGTGQGPRDRAAQHCFEERSRDPGLAADLAGRHPLLAAGVDVPAGELVRGRAADTQDLGRLLAGQEVRGSLARSTLSLISQQIDRRREPVGDATCLLTSALQC
jgi:hypothetical protein